MEEMERFMTDSRKDKAVEKFEEWALLELFGHQRLAGRVTGTAARGASFVRVDVPQDDGKKKAGS